MEIMKNFIILILWNMIVLKEDLKNDMKKTYILKWQNWENSDYFYEKLIWRFEIEMAKLRKFAYSGEKWICWIL